MINSISMKLCVCLDACGLSAYALKPLAGGPSAVDRVWSVVTQLPGVVRTVVLADRTTPKEVLRGASAVFRDRWDTAVLIKALEEAQGEAQEAQGTEALLYCRLDTPFLDAEVTRQMLANHYTYVAEYSFADGYPEGVTPEIVDPRILGRLLTLAEGAPEPVDRRGLFAVVQKDINAFDVETELSPVDLRMLRATLACDIRRNFILCDRIAGKTTGNAREVGELLQRRGELLRTLPAFTSIQVVEGDVQRPIHSPYPLIRPDALETRSEMSRARFEALVQELAEFAPDGMVHISLWGEVGLHSDVAGLVEAVEAQPGLDLLVETSGVGWQSETLAAVARMHLASTRFIVDLDTDDEESYRRVRGEGFQEARRTADTLLEAHGERVYVQAVRMQETEAEVEAFYRAWKQRGAQVIVQKYDHYCGRLPDRRVADISPVSRFPCRHTQRDLYVLADGTVPMCREDIDRDHSMGNVFEDGIETVWNNASEAHLRQVRQDYPELCRGCDEYYTFNY
ncbi:MAG: spiro-SPASM protein [Spirochaetaceae bacterium]